MNLTAAGQSLLRAGEHFGSGSKPSSPIGEALSVITNGASLKRVTLVAGPADASVVLVRADYSAPAESAPQGAVADSPQPSAPEPIDVSWTEVGGDAAPTAGELTTISRPPGGAGNFNPVWQYARTQAGVRADPRGLHLDVRV